MGLRLSAKHGVNPTIPLCFWCQQGKNELILMGASYHGEAPMHMLFDYEPCDKCKADMEKGIVLVGVVEHETVKGFRAINAHWEPTTRMPGCKSGRWVNPSVGALWPTGNWAVVQPEFIMKNFQPQETVDATLKHKRAYIEDAILKRIIEQAGIQGDKHGGQTDDPDPEGPAKV